MANENSVETVITKIKKQVSFKLIKSTFNNADTNFSKVSCVISKVDIHWIINRSLSNQYTKQS